MGRRSVAPGASRRDHGRSGQKNGVMEPTFDGLQRRAEAAGRAFFGGIGIFSPRALSARLRPPITTTCAVDVALHRALLSKRAPKRIPRGWPMSIGFSSNFSTPNVDNFGC